MTFEQYLIADEKDKLYCSDPYDGDYSAWLPPVKMMGI